MAANTTQDPDDRIRELEARVEALTRELETARAHQRTTSARGRRIGDPLPKPPPPAGRLWTVRAIMFLQVIAIGTAAAFTYKASGFNFSAFTRESAVIRIDWILFASTVVALLAVVVHRRRPLGFIFFALCSGYTIFGLYLVHPAVPLVIGERTYAWLAFGLLTLWHLLIAVLCVMESRRLGRGRTRSATLATLNSAAYYPIVWYGLHSYGSANQSLIFFSLAAIALALALYAESSGAHRNYLFHVFLASALLLLNVVLYKALDGPWLIAALTLECIGLAAAFHATGIIALKSVNLIVLLVTFIVTMQAMKFTGPMYIGSQTIHSNWAQGIFTSAILLITSWYYARHIRSVKPSHRKLSGHWFLADTAFDVPSSTVSLLHAAAAALLLTLLIISDLGNLPSLPFILAVFSAGVAAIGFVLRTAQIEAGAVMLVVAAHVSFYFFLYTRKEGFTDQPYFTAFTLVLAAYTFVGGFRGERFLARMSGGRGTDYHISAAVPYIIATGSAAAIVYRYAGSSYTPLALAVIALALAGLGVALRATGLKLSAVTALAIAAGVWFYTLSRAGAVLPQREWLWTMLFVQILACVAVERSFLWGREPETPIGPTDFAAQLFALLIAGTLGTGTLLMLAPPAWRTVLVFTHAFAWIAACAVLVDAQYRWNALLILMGSAVWLTYTQRFARPDAGIAMLVTVSIVFLLVLVAIWFVLPHHPFPRRPRFAAHK